MVINITEMKLMINFMIRYQDSSLKQVVNKKRFGRLVSPEVLLNYLDFQRSCIIYFTEKKNQYFYF